MLRVTRMKFGWRKYLDSRFATRHGCVMDHDFIPQLLSSKLILITCNTTLARIAGPVHPFRNEPPGNTPAGRAPRSRHATFIRRARVRQTLACRRPMFARDMTHDWARSVTSTERARSSLIAPGSASTREARPRTMRTRSGKPVPLRRSPTPARPEPARGRWRQARSAPRRRCADASRRNAVRSHRSAGARPRPPTRPPHRAP